MKRYLINISLLFLATITFNSCLKDMPNTRYVSETELSETDDALQTLMRSTIGWMTEYQPFTQYTQQQIGYAGYNIAKDCLTADMPVRRTSNGYDRFATPWTSLNSNLSSGNPIIHPWRWYYGLINLSNIVARNITNVDSQEERVQQYYGIAIFHRALAYFDLCRMHEQKRTGVSKIDNEATENNLWGLTTVLVTESTPDYNNNPRVPYWHMYRYILTDLQAAEKYLANYVRKYKNYPDIDVVNAYMARFWMELATRFQLQPADLTEALSHENDTELNTLAKLGISSANDCYKKAQDYARKVIAKYTPLTEEEWFDVNNGFNNSENNSWVYAAIMGGESGFKDAKLSFVGHMSLEYDWGYNGIKSDARVYRMLNRALYDKMPEGDWRKPTWIDPADAGKNPDRNKYLTTFTDAEFKVVPAYVGFKFRPRGGRSASASVGATGDIPFVRVEEMHFIDIEATAYLSGLGAAQAALDSFMNTYRYNDNSYTSAAAISVNDFIDNYLLIEKRIEFWGEGQTMFDLKRRNLPVKRGYPGTNWAEAQRYNSLDGYAAGWFSFFFPRSQEINRNPACIQNPIVDVAGNYGLWTE